MLERFSVNPILPAQDGGRARASTAMCSGSSSPPALRTTRCCSGRAPARASSSSRSPTGSRRPTRWSASWSSASRRSWTSRPAAPGSSRSPAASFAGQEGVGRGVVMDFGAVKSAFVKDTEGNLLALNEIVG